MNAIGGYMELELRRGKHFHHRALRLNSARHCFEYILRARNYAKVYLPYYTCSVMLQPLQRLGIEWEFYSIDECLEPITLPNLKPKEAFVFTNYFGLKQDCMERLSKHYGNRLIADNAQAFYAQRLPGIDTFYSPRKFFGVPDGGFLYTDSHLDCELEQDTSFSRMEHLLRRIDEGPEAGYQSFKENNASLANVPIRRMSPLSEALLTGIDYQHAKDKRSRNYLTLEKSLSAINKIRLPLPTDAVPLIYPFLTTDIELKQKLISNRIFIATYWSNVVEWSQENQLEYKLSSYLLPLPIDQRYGNKDMEKIINNILINFS